MPEVKFYAPGTFCYAELISTEAEVSSKFYREFFGWGHHDIDMGDNGIYTQFHLNGALVSAQYQRNAEQTAAGVPPHWGLYIAVADVDATTTRAKELGATVVKEPFNVFDIGRMSVLLDPQGAAFNLWEEGTSCGAGVRDEPGAMCWHELMTSDTKAGGDFYTRLFEWQTETMNMGEMGDYTLFTCAEERHAGGMLQLPADKESLPAHWLLYFEVSDVDVSHESALQLGAKTIVPPTDIPTAGRFSVIQDPIGAVFGIYKSADKN